MSRGQMQTVMVCEINDDADADADAECGALDNGQRLGLMFEV